MNNKIIDAAIAKYMCNKNVVLHHIEMTLEKILDDEKCFSSSIMNDEGVVLDISDFGIEAMNMALIGGQIISRNKIIEFIKNSIKTILNDYDICVNVGVLPGVLPTNNDWCIKSLTITVYC